MRLWKVVVPVLVALAVVLAVNIATPKTSEAVIHEIIAALCSGKTIEPPGQLPNGGPSKGNSGVAALMATGFITSIDESVPGQVTVNFDVNVRNSKFISAGFDLTIPDGAGPGVDLILSPLPIPDPDFPAHKNCALSP